MGRRLKSFETALLRVRPNEGRSRPNDAARHGAVSADALISQKVRVRETST